LAKKIVLILISLVLLCGTGLFIYGHNNLKPLATEEDGKDRPFTVLNGESTYAVLERLEDEQFLPNAFILKLYVRLFQPGVIKVGKYSLNPSLPPLEILSILMEGRQELIKVTIPEGLTGRQIAELLEEEGILKASDFISLLDSPALAKQLGLPETGLEGYLYPDTYYFQKDFPAEKVITHLTGTFFTTMEEVYPYYRELSRVKMKEKIILASIIEKEYRVPDEAPLIASVFYNRLDIGMPLQSCATVIYVITEELDKPHPDRIFERDLKLESPFNTYYNMALPPAPISNPGRTALEASFNPAQSDYLFFVVKDPARGTHHFTNNLTDHNSARRSYIDGFRSK